MEATVTMILEMSGDPRVRVFRRHFSAKGAFEEMEVDAYAIITDRYVVICDTLLCPADMAEVMKALQHEVAGRQLLVINSHADWDHCWGNAYFIGERAAPIIAHTRSLARMLSEEAQVELADYRQRYALFRSVVITPPTITFATNLTIQGGDLSIELFPTPGHYSDHSAAWIPELRLLLAFDAVERPWPVVENAGAVPSMFHTLERFLELEPRRVLCSHGKASGVAVVKHNLAYLQEIERRSRVLLAERRPGNAELEHASELINYPFDEAVATVIEPGEPVNRAFYSWVHDHNVRCIIQWLMS